MALETLRNVKKVGGFPINHVDNPSYHDSEADEPIIVNHALSTITFKIQNGPIKEVGLNGCQVDTIIEAAKLILKGLDEQFPSAYNTQALSGLQYAIDCLKLRTADREARGVEGTSNG